MYLLSFDYSPISAYSNPIDYDLPTWQNEVIYKQTGKVLKFSNMISIS